MTSRPSRLKAGAAGGMTSVQLDGWLMSCQINRRRCAGTTTDSTSCVRSRAADKCGAGMPGKAWPNLQRIVGQLSSQLSDPDTALEKGWHFDWDSLQAMGGTPRTPCERSLSSEGKCVPCEGDKSLFNTPDVICFVASREVPQQYGHSLQSPEPLTSWIKYKF